MHFNVKMLDDTMILTNDINLYNTLNVISHFCYNFLIKYFLLFFIYKIY